MTTKKKPDAKKPPVAAVKPPVVAAKPLATETENPGAGTNSAAAGADQVGADATPPVTAKTAKALSVQSSREGFRRAGRVWGKEATVVPLSELTEVQIDQIKKESVLTVTEVEIPVQEAAE